MILLSITLSKNISYKKNAYGVIGNVQKQAKLMYSFRSQISLTVVDGVVTGRKHEGSFAF